MKNIYLIVGASGTGKDTIVNHICDKTNLTRVKSYTTRPRRKGKTEKLSHIFVNDNQFRVLRNKVAYSEYNGYKYCATTKQIDNNDLYIIDEAGIESLVENYKGNKQFKIIKIYTSESERKRRMELRGDTPENIESRIEYDKYAFINKVIPDIEFENENMKLCALEIYKYICEQEKNPEQTIPNNKVPNYKNVVYISHKFGGDIENIKDIERIVKELHKKYPDYLFISPCHSFGYLYDNVSYEDGLNYTLWMLDKCDEMWVTGTEWRNSIGVQAELKFADEHNIPVFVKEEV